jgi:acyl-CoA thioesterase-1
MIKIHFHTYMLLLILILLPSLWGQRADAVPPTLLVMGDSISSGYGIDTSQSWVSLLTHRLRDSAIPHQVINASISGDTTSGGLARLPAALQLHEPDVVLLELGGNDGLRGLPLGRMKENLQAMIDLAQGAGAHVVLLGMRIPPNYGPRYTEQFHGVYTDLAATNNIPLVPFLLEGVALDAELMQNDGIHPNARAQTLLLDNVWPVLKPLVEDGLAQLELLTRDTREANQVSHNLYARCTAGQGIVCRAEQAGSVVVP